MSVAGYIILTEAWSGNRKPWAATVYHGGTFIPSAGPGSPARVDGGRYVGRTGFCGSTHAAERLGSELASKDAAKVVP